MWWSVRINSAITAKNASVLISRKLRRLFEDTSVYSKLMLVSSWIIRQQSCLEMVAIERNREATVFYRLPDVGKLIGFVKPGS